MKGYAVPLAIIVGLGVFLFALLIPDPAIRRKEENEQLTRIADALELIASAVKSQ